MKLFLKTYWIGLAIAFLFFIIGFFTISDYGLNIDESAHFIRGQAYFNVFLGKGFHYPESELSGKRVSYWKNSSYDGSHYMIADIGHPPLNDILAALTNRIFFEKLGIVGDLQSYHLFEIFISSLLVFLIFFIMKEKYGTFAGIISALALCLYPLFLGESHFNIKDPVEATFFTFALYFLYRGFEKRSNKFVFWSSIFFGFAFATKYNAAFLPIIFLLYLFIIYRNNFNSALKTIFHLKWSLILYPIISLAIVLATRPYYWQDPINRFIKSFLYYKDIGTGINYQSSTFYFLGWNTYPIRFIFSSTPIVILFFTLVGIVGLFFISSKAEKKFNTLLLIWFLTPILRVTFPGSSIYSGVRQIMEYVPAMACLAGLGSYYAVVLLKKYIKSNLTLYLIILFSFVPLIITLVKLHPNENVYMNTLVGGLKGAVSQGLPGAGETMGNVYFQGMQWLNIHAEKNSLVGTPIGLASNIPKAYFRSDITFGPYFSGTSKEGEYMMEKMSVGFPLSNDYAFEYLTNALDPAYEVKEDGVTLLRIWKNDVKHTKKQYLHEGEIGAYKIEKNELENSLTLSFLHPTPVSRLEIEHNTENCKLNEAKGQIKFIPGRTRDIEFPLAMYSHQGRYAISQNKDDKLVWFFAGIKINSISLTMADSDACVLQYNKIKVFVFKE